MKRTFGRVSWVTRLAVEREWQVSATDLGCGSLRCASFQYTCVGAGYEPGRRTHIGADAAAQTLRYSRWAGLDGRPALAAPPHSSCARWCSGSTRDFGSHDPGSNPGRAAINPSEIGRPLSPDVGLLPAAQAHTLHPVAHVVAAGSGQVVGVSLALANAGGCPTRPRMEVAAALAAFQKVLQQVDHLRIPLGFAAPLLLQLPRPFPGLIVDQLRDRDLNPGIPRLVVDLHPVFRGDVAVLAVDPGARIGGIPQDVVHAGLKPQQLAGLCGDPLVGQPHGD